ncbi:MAG TPA: pitrilysin family protein [Dehalococcoidia bacterium]|nr:pitrilysin family protein [Dehalococcoidia bacterium]
MSISGHISTLPSGLRIVTTPIESTQATTVNLFVGVGSRAEPANLNGITHFLEHMIFKGTKRRPDAIMIASEIEGAGGALNAYTNKEFTCYWNVVPFDRLPTALDVVADMLLNSLLDETEIDREKTVVQQELKRTHDNPSAWASRLIGTAIYGEQPCGWDVGGSVELVDTMKRSDFIDHIDTWYQASNMVLSVAGNTTPEQVYDLAAPLFESITDGSIPSTLPYAGETRGPKVAFESRDIDQCTLFLGTPIFGRGDDGRFALRLMNDILGAGMSSRLFKEVRERRGLAYSVGSGYGHLADTGSFTISAGVEREKLTETIKVSLDELRKLASQPIEDDELRRSKDHAIGRLRLSLETAYSLGQRHGEHLLTRGEIEPLEDVVAGIEAVTPDDVLAIANRILSEGPIHASVVGPNVNEEEVAKALEA